MRQLRCPGGLPDLKRSGRQSVEISKPRSGSGFLPSNEQKEPAIAAGSFWFV